MIYNIIKNIGDVMEAKELKEEMKALQKGDILFVIGENSIGKTTLFSKVDKNIICKELNKNTAVKNLIKNDEIIKEFNIEDLLERKINTLSTGEKTLITILSNLENDMKWSTQKTIMFQAGIIKLCSKEVGTGGNVEERLEKIENYLKSGKLQVASNSNNYNSNSGYTANTVNSSPRMQVTC